MGRDAMAYLAGYEALILDVNLCCLCLGCCQAQVWAWAMVMFNQQPVQPNKDMSAQ